MQQNKYYTAHSSARIIIKACLLFIFGFCTWSHFAFAQCPPTNPDCNAANHWIFGDSCYLEFVDTGIIVRKKVYSSYEASSSYSDQSGRLLYYGNSEYIFKPNGDTLTKQLGNSSTSQGQYFLRINNSSNLYLISGDDISWDFSSRLYFNIFNRDSSRILKSKVLVYPSTELISVVNHQNKESIWIGTHEAKSDRIFFFLLNKEGLHCCPIIEHGDINFGEKHFSYLIGYGQMKFSPNGRYFAFNSNENLELSYFNSEYARLDSTEYWQLGGYGVEFSKDSRNVFTSDGVFETFILDSFPRKSAWNPIRIIRPERRQSLGALQLGRDGKIYAASFDDNYVGVIENPDAWTNDIIYTTNGVKLHPESTCQRGLPSFNASIFYTPAIDFSYTFNCETREYEFIPEDTFLNKSTRWEILNLQTNKKEHKGGFTLKHKFNEPALIEEKYKVSYILVSNGHKDTASKIITIRPQIKQDFLGNDTFYCEGSSLTLKTPENLHCIHWMGEEPNMDTTIGPYVDYAHFHKDSMVVDSTGIYFVKISDKNFCTAYDTISVGVRPIPAKPTISKNTGELASDIEEDSYSWYFNDTFYSTTKSRSIKAFDNGYYQVKLVNEYGCESELSDSFLVDWVSIKEITMNDIVSIYPNPTDDEVHVKLPSGDIFVIELFNSKGQLIRKSTVSQDHTISMNKLPSGNYIISVSHPSKGILRKEILLLD